MVGVEVPGVAVPGGAPKPGDVEGVLPKPGVVAPKPEVPFDDPDPPSPVEGAPPSKLPLA